MFSVIIADDEPWAIFGLTKLIDWESQGFSIAATAQDGIEALELIERLKPDLLISDIRMPGLDGLEVVRKLREASPSTAVILVTGYSDFSYAQEAIRHGVFDYLVKQVKKSELIAALERVKAHFENQASLDWDVYFSILEEGSARSVKDCLALLKADCPQYCNVLTCLCQKLPDTPMIRRTFLNDQTTVTLRTGSNKVLMIVCQDQPDRPFFPQANDGISWEAVGSSGVFSTDLEFYELYRRSEMAMMTAVVQKKKYVLYDGAIPAGLDYILGEFSASLRRKDRESILLQYHTILDFAVRLSFDNLVEIANRMIAQIREYKFGAYEALELRHEMLISPASPVEELFSPIERCLASENEKSSCAPSQIMRITEYIDNHYTEELRITDLARQFFISSNYLSILLKRETGSTFTEHIISKRITLAKQLLAQTDTPIQDIVEQVGYKEYSCFIKLFKKHTGMTPYIYRKENRK